MLCLSQPAVPQTVVKTDGATPASQSYVLHIVAFYTTDDFEEIKMNDEEKKKLNCEERKYPRSMDRRVDWGTWPHREG